MSDTTAILLLQMGGPDSLEAVRPFLLNLFSDREIIKIGPAWLQPLIARMIVRRRTPAVMEKYREIGGRSPIQKLTQAQAEMLAAELGIPCHVGMRYWHPFTAETLARLRKNGVRKLVALSLYPHYSRATSGSSFNDLTRCLADLDSDLEVVRIPHFYNHPLYIDALAEKVEAGLASFPDRAGVQLLFSAHSLPQSFIAEGDPYLEQIQTTVRLVMERFEGVQHRLAFQSRAGPVKWLEPSTDDTLKELAASGCRNLLVVPLSFVSDHIETLHEIDIEYAAEAHKLGISNFRRTESLNSSPAFISCLAELVRQALKAP
ncbi:ferrochelatase [Trichlorobacter lovleyi]|uniref:ferrochelatase n=1 Tax=Trichlorobacter lovleyi TaxID=313985 RepID=UPI00223FC09B|nr:ferrochelatase [Trichlorobacter lovleyi]QOX79930.1 ferrochelatase [Trichlorobacter lovleyi]